ncbi:hypothetical protein E0E50_11770 [Azotobacter chroococcum subsp. isscasi]|uniref:Hint domain-containing protein n=1 Tax=Azotobacter chroococcum TaxID=353 RepID=UPI00103B189D|nr:Hint domain-containing protein [Azotobacter chroococcum]TBW09528.1 hypothetical protein E0E50_11770 [Azotobacter chroococcum subsp. isscasi]
MPKHKETGNLDCYDGETEILTKNGWMKFPELPRNLPVLTLNPSTLTAEWRLPYKYTNQPYQGPMYLILSKKLDLLITPEHNFLIENRKGKLKTRSIKDISQHQDRIPAHCNWVGKDIPLLTDDMCALIGFYLAEGCAYGVSGGNRYNRGWPVFFSQTEGPKGGDKGDVRKQFTQILHRLNYKYRETKIGLSIQNKDLWELLYPLGNKYTKYIPRDWLDLPSNKLRTLLHWMILGDGVIRRTNSSGESERAYYTVSKTLADNTQELAIKTGASANISIKPLKSSTLSCGRIITPTVPLYEVRLYRNKYNYFRDTKESYITQQYFKGQVHCIGVDNHIIMVRRDKKICWSGTMEHGDSITPVEEEQIQTG